MKRIAFLFTFLVYAFAANTYAQTKSQMLTDWQRAKDYTKEYLDTMPADGYGFKPTPEIRSFAEQMLHIADGNYYLLSLAAGKTGPYGKEMAEKVVPQTKEATTKAVLESYDFMIDAIKQMSPAQLAEIVPFHQEKVSRETVINKAFEHQTHHRGQTTIYLRLKGVKPPAERL